MIYNCTIIIFPICHLLIADTSDLNTCKVMILKRDNGEGNYSSADLEGTIEEHHINEMKIICKLIQRIILKLTPTLILK